MNEASFLSLVLFVCLLSVFMYDTCFLSRICTQLTSAFNQDIFSAAQLYVTSSDYIAENAINCSMIFLCNYSDMKSKQ